MQLLAAPFEERDQAIQVRKILLGSLSGYHTVYHTVARLTVSLQLAGGSPFGQCRPRLASATPDRLDRLAAVL
jgi:hypothetical protein